MKLAYISPIYDKYASFQNPYKNSKIDPFQHIHYIFNIINGIKNQHFILKKISPLTSWNCDILELKLFNNIQKFRLNTLTHTTDIFASLTKNMNELRIFNRCVPIKNKKMQFLDKILGSQKPENPNKLQKIEKELNCKFPKRFHDFISKYQGKEIILDLPDEKYHVLLSITNGESEKDPNESVTYRSNRMKTHQVLKSDTRKLPFARNLSGDQFKYLFFEGEEGKEFDENIYFTDADSLIGEIEITNSIDIFESTLQSENDSQLIIDCKVQSSEKLFTDFQLPKPISYWSKSFGISSHENIKKYPNGFSVQQHAINYHFENPQENIAKFEIQLVFATEDKLIFTSSAYEIDNSNLEDSINYNVEYRIYYFKLFSIVDALIKSKEIAVENGFVSEKEFMDLIDVKQLFQLTNQVFQSIDTKEV